MSDHFSRPFSYDIISGMALLNMSALPAFEVGKADHTGIPFENGETDHTGIPFEREVRL